MGAYRAYQRLVLAFIASVFAMLLVVLPILLTQVVRADLPPRPPPLAEPGSGGGLAGVASIELRVRFAREEQAGQWQELWTVVEWQDAFGGWHEVEGWRGTLDEIVNGEGRKVWWVYQRDLGTGPFRWTVYRSPSGGLLAHSEPFDLPGAAGQTTGTRVALAP